MHSVLHERLPSPQADLLASLAARVELLVEEALRSQEAEAEAEAEGQGAGAGGGGAAAARHPLLCSAAELAREGGCDVALPRRVLLPWLVGRVCVWEGVVGFRCQIQRKQDPEAEGIALRMGRCGRVRQGSGTRLRALVCLCLRQRPAFARVRLCTS